MCLKFFFISYLLKYKIKLVYFLVFIEYSFSYRYFTCEMVVIVQQSQLWSSIRLRSCILFTSSPLVTSTPRMRSKVGWLTPLQVSWKNPPSSRTFMQCINRDNLYVLWSTLDLVVMNQRCNGQNWTSRESGRRWRDKSDGLESQIVGKPVCSAENTAVGFALPWWLT